MQILITKNIKFLSLFIIILTAAGCATPQYDLNTPDGLFAQAKEYEKSERYEIAISKYNDIKNRFPYSNFSTQSELAIAEVQYLRENYSDAEIAFQNFRDLHPKHPKTDYVIYRIAMSYYMQLPDTNDRDLTLGNDAIYHFDEVTKLFPKSEYSGESKLKRSEIFNRLAEKELYVADFYFKQEKFSAALKRFEQCLKKYSGIGFDPRAHLGALNAAKKTDNFDKVKFHSNELKTKYPNSAEAQNLNAGSNTK